MPSVLPDDTVDELSAILGPLSDFIAGGGQVTDSYLDGLLQREVGRYTPEIKAEAKLWASELLRARNSSQQQIHDSVANTLAGRGIKDAYYVLALKKVTQRQSKPVQLKASAAQIDFGTLPPNQTDTRQIVIIGGPGSVVAGAGIQVSPVHFGPGSTTLTIKVAPPAGSQQLSTQLIASNDAQQTLTIPVIARWRTVTPSPTPSWRRFATGVLAAILLLAGYSALFSDRNGGSSPTPEYVTRVVIVAEDPTATLAARPTAKPTRVPATPIPPTESPTRAATRTPTRVPTKVPTRAPTHMPIPKSPVVSLVLINADNDRRIRDLSDGDTVRLSELSTTRLDIEARVNDSNIESVSFKLDGQSFCTNGRCIENGAPYAMNGDAGGDHYNNWDWSALIGTHTISAMPCTGNDGNGTCGPSMTVRITVTR